MSDLEQRLAAVERSLRWYRWLTFGCAAGLALALVHGCSSTHDLTVNSLRADSLLIGDVSGDHAFLQKHALELRNGSSEFSVDLGDERLGQRDSTLRFTWDRPDAGAASAALAVGSSGAALTLHAGGATRIFTSDEAPH